MLFSNLSVSIIMYCCKGIEFALMSLVEDVVRSLKTETLLFSHIEYMFSILSMFSILPDTSCIN